MATKKTPRPLTPFEFVLISASLGLAVLLSLQFILGQLLHQPIASVAANVIPTATITRGPTVTSDVVVFVATATAPLPDQNFPSTWTVTPTWTPRPTHTPTPTDT